MLKTLALGTLAVSLLGVAGWGASSFIVSQIEDSPAILSWGAGALAAEAGSPESQVDVRSETKLAGSKAGDFDQALALIRAARDQFASVKDYQCTYLRDESIDGVLQQNHIKLKIRHEPFSVYMEWVAPRSKAGRKTVYVEGQNNGKMLVKSVLTLRLDPQKSIELKESRHVITEIGLKNAMDRCQKSWEKEKAEGATEVSVQDAELKIALDGQELVKPCVCVTTVHKPQQKPDYLFHKTRFYFDKETKLVLRIEGYDWPKEGQAPALPALPALLERYTYLDVKTNLGLKDGDFRF